MAENGENKEVSGNEQGEKPVGPGNPPKEHRWKPGQSGNPAGRTPSKPITDAIKKICNGPVKLKIDGEEVTISGVEALAQIAYNKAMKGDFRYWNAIIERSDGKVTEPIDLDVRDERQLPGLTPELLAKIADAKEGPE